MLVLALLALLGRRGPPGGPRGSGKGDGVGPACEHCKKTTEQIKELVEANLTYDEIYSGVVEYCNNLSSPLDKMCVGHVNLSLNSTLDLLSNGTDVKDICENFASCGEAGLFSQRSDDSPECSQCNRLTRLIGRMMDQTSSSDEIIANITAICSSLHSRLSEGCTSFINKYASDIIELLNKSVDPDVVCERLNICSVYSKPSLKTKRIEFHKVPKEAREFGLHHKPKPCKPCKPCMKFLKTASKKKLTSAEELLELANSTTDDEGRRKFPFVNESNVDSFLEALSFSKEERLAFCNESGFCLPPPPPPDFDSSDHPEFSDFDGSDMPPRDGPPGFGRRPGRGRDEHRGHGAPAGDRESMPPPPDFDSSDHSDFSDFDGSDMPPRDGPPGFGKGPGRGRDDEDEHEGYGAKASNREKLGRGDRRRTKFNKSRD